MSLPAVSYHESILKILSMDSRKEPTTTTGTIFERMSADVDDDLVLILGARGSACIPIHGPALLQM